jgi:hypothetical protein
MMESQKARRASGTCTERLLMDGGDGEASWAARGPAKTRSLPARVARAFLINGMTANPGERWAKELLFLSGSAALQCGH